MMEVEHGTVGRPLKVAVFGGIVALLVPIQAEQGRL